MYNNFFKRIIDLALASIAILMLLPLFIPVVFILRFTGEGEIFYFQKRVGYKNDIFYICKFATMVKNSSNIGSKNLTIRNDPRVLPFGKILRKTKINELPQIFNVFIGNMSIVGPRPQMESSFNAYPKNIQDVIYNTKPGITGIGSIVFRDEEDLITKHAADPHKFYQDVIAPYKGNLELWYQKNLGLIVDFKLIITTALVIIFPKSKFYLSWFKSLPKKNIF